MWFEEPPTALAVQTDDPAAPPPTVLVDGVPWPYRLATVVPVGETTWESELQPTRVRPTSPDDEVRLPRLLLLTVPESGTLQVEDTIIEPLRFPKPARWSRVPPPDVPPHWTWPPARVDRIPKIPWRGGVWR